MRNSNRKISASVAVFVLLCTITIPIVHSQLEKTSTPQIIQTITPEYLEEIIYTKKPLSIPGLLNNNPPNIHLPASQVTLKIFSSSTSYFRTQLLNVPPGYEVGNKNYTGWCTDSAHYINYNTAYQVTLYSSYNTSLPGHLAHQNWSKVNYILNHKIGTDWHQVQYAILYIMDFGNQGLSTNGWTMVNNSKLYGGSYIPAGGDIIAIIADAGVTVQRTIFELIVPTYTLSISITGQGSILKNPNQTTYTYGQVVHLIAQPNPGWYFSQWGGNLSGSTNPISLSMTGNKTVTATFNQYVYTLSLSMSGSGSGTIQASPAGPYYYGAVVTVWANASVGSRFIGFSGNLSGVTTPQTLVMNGNKSVNAGFALRGPFSLSLTMSGSGSGTIQASPAGPYYYGAVVTVWANASVGSRFIGFSGNLSGVTTPQTLVMNGNKSVNAAFTLNGSYALIITVNPVDSGSVTATPSGPYYYGTVVTLTAIANPGYTFDHWSGDASGTNPITSVTMTGNKSITAHFAPNQYTLTIIIDGEGTVLKNPDHSTYTYNSVVKLTAVPKANWVFSSWSGDLTGNVNPQSITMTENKTVTAHFTYDGEDTDAPVLEITKPIRNGMYIFNQFVMQFKALKMPIIVHLLTIEVNVSDNESGIDHVEFYINGVLKSNDDSAPYSFNWITLICGKYNITVKAYDNVGNVAISGLTVFRWRIHPVIDYLLIFFGIVLKAN